MPTASESIGSYAECDEFIDYQLQVARRRIKWADLLTAALLAAVLWTGYVLVFTILDHWVISGGFSPLVRGVMLAIVLLVCAGIVFWYVIRPWSSDIHPLYAASMLDQSGTELNGALMSLVDLNTAGSEVPETIRNVMEKRAAVKLAEVNIDEAIDRRWLMRLGYILLALVLITCVYAVMSPKAISLARSLTLSSSSVATTTRVLKVQPGDSSIDAGQQVEIVADIGGSLPEAVTVLFTTADRTYVDEPLTMQPTDDEGRFRVLMVGDSNRGLRQSLSYRVVAGDAVSPEYAISVTQPPSAQVTQLEYEYPAYMTLPQHVSTGGNIDAWDGTLVRIIAEANAPLVSAMLRFSDDPGFTRPAEETVLSINDGAVTGVVKLELRGDGSSPKYYRVEVKDSDGRTDPSPTVYTVNVRPDLPPTIRLLDPLKDITVPANAIVPLLVNAEDPDFLLRSVKLNFEVNGELRAPELLFDATRAGLKKSWMGTWDFSLKTLSLKPGDVVRYFITARDNKPPLGSQSRTGVLQLLIEEDAVPEDVEKKLREDKQRQKQQVQEAGQQQPRNEEPDTQNQEQTGQPNQQDESSEANSNDGEPDAPNSSTEDEKRSSRGNLDAEQDKQGELGQKQTEAPEETDGNGTMGQSDSSEEAPVSGERKNVEGTRRSDEPAADDEALQKLLERYSDSTSQEPEEDSGADPGAKSDPPNSGTDKPSDSGVSNMNSSNEPDVNSGSSESESKTDAQNPTSDNTDESNAADAGTDREQTTDGGTDRPDPEAEPDSGNSPRDGNPVEGAEQQPDGDAADKTDKSGDGESPQDNKQDSDGDTEDQQGDQAEQNGDQAELNGDQAELNGDQAELNGDQTGQKGDQAGQKGDQAGQKGDQAGQKGDQAGQKGDQAGQKGDQAGQKGDQAGQKGDQAGQKGDQAGQKGDQAGQKGDQAGQKGDQAGQKGDQAGQKGDQAGQKGDQAGQKGDQAGQKGDQAGQKGDQAGQKGDQAGQKGDQAGQKGDHAGQKGDQAGQEGGQTGQKGDQAGQKGDQAGQKGDQAGQKGDQPGQVGGSNQGSSSQNRSDGGGQGGVDTGQPSNEGGAGSDESSEFQTGDSDVNDAANTADLVLKRLQKDLERGKVDQQLLDDLGWTEDELKRFSQRMQKQLSAIKELPQEDASADRLQRRRVEEMLRSLDLKSSSKGKIGQTTRNVEQQDTTSRKARPPAQYRDLLKMFQKSLSEGARQ